MNDNVTQVATAETSRRNFLKASTAALATAALASGPRAVHGAVDAPDLRVGAAAADLEADDSMVVAGSILPRYVKGQEGKLRAVAVVIENPPSAKLAIVACDVLMMTRDQLDPVADEIERTCGIPASNVLIHCTHTHHAPSTCRVHGYDRDEVFSERVQRAIVKAVTDANGKLVDSTLHFKLGQEKTVITELANDWIGYVGDREAYELGGYQVWMGLHSYVEPGTGERMVEEAVEMLKELAR